MKYLYKAVVKEHVKLPLDLTKYPKLSKEQAGHLRHFYNLSAANDEPAQEFLDAYRYQLATMVYAAALTHFHRMPAMRTLFQRLIRRLIYKMLRREVWGYWYLTSQSGIRLDPDLKELRKPWANPFERQGSLTFEWDPLFWGMGKESFAYDNGSLQEAILEEMERNGWIGVCCEPSLVFVACNQFPIIAMRLNDIRRGTNIVETVLEKYRFALKSNDMISRNELYRSWLSVKQGTVSPARSIGFTAWAAAFMNSWNTEFVEIQHPAVATFYRAALNQQLKNVDDDHSHVLHEARRHYIAARHTNSPSYNEPTLGYFVQWLSELGKTTELEDLLAYVDANLAPAWQDGGLYYPRCGQATDDEGQWTRMDPFSGNAAIGYARLNVEDGQKRIWDNPWTKEDVSSRPWVDGLDLSHGVDCLRDIFDENVTAMTITFQEWAGQDVKVSFEVKKLPGGRWGIYQRHKEGVVYESLEGVNIPVDINIKAGREVDIVIIK
ncbi:hypothetical protein BGW36DRAFT_398874 [Talaromyces proteolyticus]|uniref:Linalool dehydratase/isomerase domain-containing protein n=1 Tax=Talaromyces proteolyticus TaxID=1131652 RepID=A0AAD4KPY6_9EURO|nr:uncharacterized protein BGW36DRAFT_398874 [Talaromyces proteolyticus]KAH8693554.1 hypothetical protein BGW36DRAFT_398874 [Talaromyces proteolyticus]